MLNNTVITTTTNTNTDVNENPLLGGVFENLHTIVVHGGVFHLDEAIFTALAQLARLFMGLSLLKVIRTNKVQPDWTLENGYLVGDIGGGRYDHHDKVPKTRSNGNPYAAGGLLLKDIWMFLGLSMTGFLTIDKEFVEPADIHDNTGRGNELSKLIKALNPNWDQPSGPDDVNKRFDKAVDIIMTLLEAQLDRVRSAEDLTAAATAALQQIDGVCIYLDRYIPIATDIRIKESKVLFIGFPSARGGYQLTAIRLEDGSSKMLFPEEVRGYSGEPLPSGMTFCHKAGFTASFVSREAAKRFADQTFSTATAV